MAVHSNSSRRRSLCRGRSRLFFLSLHNNAAQLVKRKNLFPFSPWFSLACSLRQTGTTQLGPTCAGRIPSTWSGSSVISQARCYTGENSERHRGAGSLFPPGRQQQSVVRAPRALHRMLSDRALYRRYSNADGVICHTLLSSALKVPPPKNAAAAARPPPMRP